MPKKVLVVPYIPGLSNSLQSVAKRYEIVLWYSYGGRLGDGFSSSYKEKVDKSKQRYAVYEACAVVGKGTWEKVKEILRSEL